MSFMKTFRNPHFFPRVPDGGDLRLGKKKKKSQIQGKFRLIYYVFTWFSEPKAQNPQSSFCDALIKVVLDSSIYKGFFVCLFVCLSILPYSFSVHRDSELLEFFPQRPPGNSPSHLIGQNLNLCPSLRGLAALTGLDQ